MSRIRLIKAHPMVLCWDLKDLNYGKCIGQCLIQSNCHEWYYYSSCATTIFALVFWYAMPLTPNFVYLTHLFQEHMLQKLPNSNVSGNTSFSSAGLMIPLNSRASQVTLVVKNLPVNAGDVRHRFNSCIRKIPWRSKWQPNSVLLPGKSHGQRSLVGYGPQGCKESDRTEVTWY